MLVRTRTLWDSPTILGNSDASGRILQELLVCTGMDSREPVSGVGVSLRNGETPRKVGEGDDQLAPLEALSSLETRLLRMAQEGRLVDEKAPSEGEMGSLSAVSPGTGAGRGPMCFSCGHQGHGVNRCSQVDTYFPFLPPGWAVSEMANIWQHGLMELDWGLLPETRDGPGGRVSLLDHQGSRYD